METQMTSSAYILISFILNLLLILILVRVIRVAPVASEQGINDGNGGRATAPTAATVAAAGCGGGMFTAATCRQGGVIRGGRRGGRHAVEGAAASGQGVLAEWRGSRGKAAQLHLSGQGEKMRRGTCCTLGVKVAAW